MDAVKLCACGQPLHYTDPNVQFFIEKLCEMYGERIKVSCMGRSWMVPRHYLALHYVRGEELGTPALPEFEEVDP